jgi:hypothetical protein
MPKGRQFVFSYQGLAEALVKQPGIRAGPWGTNAEFETGAAGVNNAPGIALVTAPSFLSQGRPLRGTTMTLLAWPGMTPWRCPPTSKT